MTIQRSFDNATSREKRKKELGNHFFLALLIVLFANSGFSQKTVSPKVSFWLGQSYTHSGLNENHRTIFIHKQRVSSNIDPTIRGRKTTLAFESLKGTSHFSFFGGLDIDTYWLDYFYDYTTYDIVDVTIDARETARLFTFKALPGFVFNPEAKRNRTKIYGGIAFSSLFSRKVTWGWYRTLQLPGIPGTSATVNEGEATSDKVIQYVNSRSSFVSPEMMLHSSWKLNERWKVSASVATRLYFLSLFKDVAQVDFSGGVSIGYAIKSHQEIIEESRSERR